MQDAKRGNAGLWAQRAVAVFVHSAMDCIQQWIHWPGRYAQRRLSSSASTGAYQSGRPRALALYL